MQNKHSHLNSELSQKKIYENTLKELKPIEMRNLFPTKDPIEVSNGIQKMLQGYNEKNKINENLYFYSIA